MGKKILVSSALIVSLLMGYLILTPAIDNISFLQTVPSFSLTRGPYIQNVTQTSALIRFSTDIAVIGTVKYTDGVTPLSITESTAQQVHSIKLPNLQPGTIYRYSVRFSPTAKEPKYAFKTSPVTGFTGKLRFAHVSDMGWDRYTYKIPVLNQMTRWNPEFVIHSGDVNVYNGLEQDYNQRFFDPYKVIIRTVPFYPVMGNHDAITKWPFLQDFDLPYRESGSKNENYYSFNKGSVHFIGLDTNFAYAPGSSQLNWLKQDLLNRDLINQPFTIVYFHHPAFSDSYHGSTPSVQQYIVPILEQAGNVTLVLNGHDHVYEKFGPYNGITYAVAGGGGQGNYDCGMQVIPEKPVLCVKTHFFIGFVAGPAKLTAQVIDLNGILIDKMVFRK